MSDRGLAEPVDLDQLAYVIYTSGSTGKPKGTMLSHRAVSHFLDWYCGAVDIASRDRVMLKTPITFDVSVPELFGTLARGATLVIARPDGHKDPDYLEKLIAAEDITHVHFVPSMFRAYLQSNSTLHSSLRNIEVGGEALTADLVNGHHSRQDCPLINLYGPTEAAVWVTHGRMLAGEPVTLGAPARGCPMYVLDDNLAKVPTGTTGELFIGGVQLARGYHGRPDLTAAAFVPDPFAQRPGDRMYRTGDLARFCAGGTIDFLGRNDHQVKVRGYRIELGEIESTALAHDAVAHCVVTARDVGDDMQLVAYLVVSDRTITPADLRGHLAAALPEYMVPAAVVILESMPLNTSGKVDRGQLPPPQRSDFVSPRSLVAPRTADEAALVKIWQDVFKLGEIGVQDDFWELGGHSLLAARVASMIASDLSVQIEVRSLFDHPTIEALAHVVSRARTTVSAEAATLADALVPVIAPIGDRANPGAAGTVAPRSVESW